MTDPPDLFFCTDTSKSPEANTIDQSTLPPARFKKETRGASIGITNLQSVEKQYADLLASKSSKKRKE